MELSSCDRCGKRGLCSARVSLSMPVECEQEITINDVVATATMIEEPIEVILTIEKADNKDAIVKGYVDAYQCKQAAQEQDKCYELGYKIAFKAMHEGEQDIFELARKNEKKFFSALKKIAKCSEGYFTLPNMHNTLPNEDRKMKIISTFPFTFYGQLFEIYYCDDGEFYLPLAKVCESIGVDSSGQRQRISRDEAIADSLKVIDVVNINEETGRATGNKTACLAIKRLPYWLGTISTSQVKEEVKPKIILFKREFADAAWAIFRTDLIPEDILAKFEKVSLAR